MQLPLHCRYLLDAEMGRKVDVEEKEEMEAHNKMQEIAATGRQKEVRVVHKHTHRPTDRNSGLADTLWQEREREREKRHRTEREAQCPLSARWKTSEEEEVAVAEEKVGS